MVNEQNDESQAIHMEQSENNNGKSSEDDVGPSEVESAPVAEKPVEKKKGFFKRKFEAAKEAFKERQEERKKLKATEKAAFREERAKSAANIGKEKAQVIERREIKKIREGGSFSQFAKGFSQGPVIDVGGSKKIRQALGQQNGGNPLTRLGQMFAPQTVPGIGNGKGVPATQRRVDTSALDYFTGNLPTKRGTRNVRADKLDYFTGNIPRKSGVAGQLPDIFGLGKRPSPAASKSSMTASKAVGGPSREQRQLDMTRRINELTGNKPASERKPRSQIRFI